MAIYIRREHIERILTMPLALEAVEDALREMGKGLAPNLPRGRVRVPGGMLHMMSAALPREGVMGYKAYSTFRTLASFLFFLYSAKNGELLAIMEADKLGQMRTGAASGVATKYMARPDAKTIGIFGTGWQAQSQLEAVCAVRNIHLIKAYSRNPESRKAFCEERSKTLGVEVVSAQTPEEVVRGADIIIIITTSREPVLNGEWLEKGAHINAAGSNALIRREVDETTVARSDIIVVDSKDEAKVECGDLLAPIERGVTHWGRIYELGDVVVGRVKGREENKDITLFESQGLALEDVAVAAKIYEAAKDMGVGEKLPI